MRDLEKMTVTLSQKKRAAIIDAAIREFHDSGYDTATMDAVARRAEVSKRTVYNHFESKEALFLEISDQLCSAVVNVSDLPYSSRQGIEEQLLEIALRSLELMSCEDFLVMARVTLPERMRQSPLTNGAFDRIRNGETGLARWLAKAAADGRLEISDPTMAGRLFTAMLLEFAFWPQLLTGEPTPSAAAREKLAAEVVGVFLNGVLPPAST